jgi:hypothetical protein
MKDATAILNQVTNFFKLAIGSVVLVLLAGTAARAARLGIPWLPALDPTQMAYLAGAWWLVR